nr:repetitive proline-rich cell wall protein-like [Megalopta genalis]
MLRLLIPCLIWLSSVRSEMSAQMLDGMVEENGAMTEAMMVKPKRESYHNPCPPVYSHPISYSPPPQIYVKPVVHQAPMPVYHQPIQVVQKPMITYVKPAPPPVIVKPVVQPVVQPKVVLPVYQKPMISYAPVYQKPVYYAPMVQKVMYEQPKVLLKKYEVPITQVIQKPQISYPVQYHQPKLVHVPPPQLNYVKISQPVVHPQPVFQSPVKPWCP